MSDTASSPGLLASLRRAAGTLGALAANRLELFLLELQEERDRVLEVVVLCLLAVLGAGFALALLTGTVLYLFWDTHPLAALLGLTLFYGGGAAAAVWRVWQRLQESRPFASSLAEFRKDQVCFQADPATPSASASNSSSSKAN